jgi:hypothetical protein
LSHSLLYKYNCHINVEICNSVAAVKYLFKYIFKGPDKAAVNIIEDSHIQPIQQAAAPVIIDEIQAYIDARWVGAQEAVWRISGNDMSERYPPITRLQIHLENMQQVLYREGKNNLQINFLFFKY